MKVAVIQMNAGPDKASNNKRAQEYVRQAIAQKAQMMALPEVFNFRGEATLKEISTAIAEKVPGESLRPLMALARRHKVFILAGSIYEKAKGQQKVYNTSVLINPQGKITACYRKINLFDARIGKKSVRESRIFLAGKETASAPVEGFRLGLSICFDVRFPSLYQRYAQQSCDILSVVSSFTARTGWAHWEVLLRARAIETRSYVLAPNQTGKNAQGIETYGHSLIVDPWGEILAEASGEKEETIYADIRRDILEDIRRRLCVEKAWTSVHGKEGV